MQQRVADIIADILVEHGITDIFSLVGGGAMFLNDAFGHHKGLRVMYNQHEQACSMAAEGYVRATGRMAAVCVTTGPGGTNAITGVLGAYQDNYPMLVISGQVRYETTVDSTGLPLRFLGEQEHDIVNTVRPLTKYAVMVKRVEDVRYEIEKAMYIAQEGRRGPCWVDIPLNIQSAPANPDSMRPFVAVPAKREWNHERLLDELKKARRPVILTGSAIRSSGLVQVFRQLTEQLKIPVLAATYNADVMTWQHPYYFGNFGINGGRAGNFIVQNADLVIGLGCRMAYRQIGFNFESFSPQSRKVVVDIDEAELRKPTMSIHVPICADLADVLSALSDSGFAFKDSCGWLEYCCMLRERFPVYQQKFEKSNSVNPYYLMHRLQKVMPEDGMIVLGNSSIAGQILQMGIHQEGQRIINNMNCGSMGYDLPAAIGAARGTGQDVLLITGDGSLMLNLQELATLQHYHLPVKVFVCNNGGYRGIVRSQGNMFQGRFTGCTEDTGVKIPSFEKLAAAFELPYFSIESHARLDDVIKKILQTPGALICEIMQDWEQVIEPRTMSRRLEDGSIVSPPIDDLFPFLDPEIYQQIQFERFSEERGVTQP